MNEPKPKWVSEPNESGWWAVRDKESRNTDSLLFGYFTPEASGGFIDKHGLYFNRPELEYTFVQNFALLISKRQIDGEKQNEGY